MNIKERLIAYAKYNKSIKQKEREIEQIKKIIREEKQAQLNLINIEPITISLQYFVEKLEKDAKNKCTVLVEFPYISGRRNLSHDEMNSCFENLPDTLLPAKVRIEGSYQNGCLFYIFATSCNPRTTELVSYNEYPVQKDNMLHFYAKPKQDLFITIPIEKLTSNQEIEQIVHDYLEEQENQNEINS